MVHYKGIAPIPLLGFLLTKPTKDLLPAHVVINLSINGLFFRHDNDDDDNDIEKLRCTVSPIDCEKRKSV